MPAADEVAPRDRGPDPRQRRGHQLGDREGDRRRSRGSRRTAGTGWRPTRSTTTHRPIRNEIANSTIAWPLRQPPRRGSALPRAGPSSSAITGRTSDSRTWTNTRTIAPIDDRQDGEQRQRACSVRRARDPARRRGRHELVRDEPIATWSAITSSQIGTARGMLRRRPSTRCRRCPGPGRATGGPRRRRRRGR